MSSTWAETNLSSNFAYEWLYSLCMLFVNLFLYIVLHRQFLPLANETMSQWQTAILNHTNYRSPLNLQQVISIIQSQKSKPIYMVENL